ncbi:hypothetical protein GCM10027360_42730 [Amycolatopsis echigonensis]
MLPGPPCTTTTAGAAPPGCPVTRYQVRCSPNGTQPFAVGATAMLVTSFASLVLLRRGAAGSGYLSIRRGPRATSP